MDDAHWPDNVHLGPDSVISGNNPFQQFRSTQPRALEIGSSSTMEDVRFAIGHLGTLRIGDFCWFTNVTLLCEESIRIGNYVVAGWNVTISDADFHPISPEQRKLDAIACAPTNAGMMRPPFRKEPVIIDDDVWIGAGATILKGVHVSRGAWIEPGSVVLVDVPAHGRVAGNPATIVACVEHHG